MLRKIQGIKRLPKTNQRIEQLFFTHFKCQKIFIAFDYYFSIAWKKIIKYDRVLLQNSDRLWGRCPFLIKMFTNPTASYKSAHMNPLRFLQDYITILLQLTSRGIGMEVITSVKYKQVAKLERRFQTNRIRVLKLFRLW